MRYTEKSKFDLNKKNEINKNIYVKNSIGIIDIPNSLLANQMSNYYEESKKTAQKKSLDDTMKEKYRSHFGDLINQVRLYENPKLDEIGEKGFANGNEIHIAKSAFNLHTSEGEKLLDHEMGHIIQQNNRIATGKDILLDESLEGRTEINNFNPIQSSSLIAGSDAPIQGNRLTKLFKKMLTVGGRIPGAVGGGVLGGGSGALIGALIGGPIGGIIGGVCGALTGGIGGSKVRDGLNKDDIKVRDGLNKGDIKIRDGLNKDDIKSIKESGIDPNVIGEIMTIYEKNKGNITSVSRNSKGGEAWAWDNGELGAKIVDYRLQDGAVQNEADDIKKQSLIIHELTHLAVADSNIRKHKPIKTEDDERKMIEKMTQESECINDSDMLIKELYNLLDKLPNDFLEKGYIKERIKYIEDNVGAFDNRAEIPTVINELYYLLHTIKDGEYRNTELYQKIESLTKQLEEERR